MAFKVPHHLRIFNTNIHCAFVSSVVFTTKHRINIGLRSTISLIVNNMVNAGRLVNLNTLSNNLIVIISVVNHIFFVTSWPFFALTQSSIAQIKLANCWSAMLELVKSAQRKPRARSPSIGLIVQRCEDNTISNILVALVGPNTC